MKTPDQLLFESDLEDAGYRTGVLAGRWGLAEANAVPDSLAWPKVCFWLRAAERPNAPARYYVMLDVAGYRSVPPTGSFFDPTQKAALTVAKFPKGKGGSRFAMVFRTDWEPGRCKAFYHPYDRFTLSSHPGWITELPHLVWNDRHTIVDYLNEFQSLLMGNDYVGQ